MCQFLSAIAFRDGSVRALPEFTDSHNDLVEWYGLDDNKPAMLRNWVCVEFAPESAPYHDLDRYELKLDVPSDPPGWWEGVRNEVERTCREMVAGMMVTDKREILLGGCWILSGEADVDRMVNARIVTMSDSSRVGSIYESSRVGSMYDSSRVGTMYESSRVGSMYESSRVGSMCGSSRVGSMYDSSRVGSMYGSSRVGSMYDSSRVGTISDSSRVGSIYESSRVGTISDSSRVGSIYESSHVGQDHRKEITDAH